MKKSISLSKIRFVCVGENIKNGIRQGVCGDIHSLEEWISLLFGEKGHAYFAGADKKEILDYIQTYGGKRLKIWKA